MKTYIQLTLFAEASPVKGYPVQVKEKELKEMKGAVFGGKCTDLSTNYDPELQLWKTYPRCCGKEEACTLSCLTWPKSGIMQNGRLYQLDNLEPPTCENVFLSLPTPTRSDPDKQGNGSLIRLIETGNSYASSHKRHKPTLNTPTVNTSKNSPQTTSQWKRKACLNVDAARLSGYNKQTIKTTGKAFRLNPHFVTEMMGFPIDWLD